MRFARNLTATSAAVLVLLVAAAVSGVGAAAGDALKATLVRDVRQPFTVSMSANAGTVAPSNCQAIPLPAGDLVIENINGLFTGPVDGFLALWKAIGPNGQSTLTVPLEGAQRNLATNAGEALQFHGMLVVVDGHPGQAGPLFRDADDPVRICLEDADTSIGEGGSVQISGYILR